MILIFDLDDTLYDEMSFVKSGLRAVAHFGEETFGWNTGQSFSFLETTLATHGRGKVFNEWLSSHGRLSRALVARCVHLYRHHSPEISLSPLATNVLKRYQGQQTMYLVTDGHKLVQENKVNALQIAPYFKRMFITHRFGIAHAKPSLHCFEIIRRAEKCNWTDMVYVGDNPAKDFVNLNNMGALTIRVSTGSHAEVKPLAGYDARFTIHDLSTLQPVLDQWSIRSSILGTK